MASLIVRYGNGERFAARFTLSRSGKLLGQTSGPRLNAAESWSTPEVREPDLDDPAHVRIIAALTEILEQYSGSDDA